MNRFFFLAFILSTMVFSLRAQQAAISNKHFSLGSYGRAGIARGDKIQYPRSLNLDGLGSIGGRMEEGDYFELATALRFAPVSGTSDSAIITVQPL